MGIHNRITAERYHQIKAELHSAKDDKTIMEKYDIGATTAWLIRNTSSFYEYRLRTDPKLRKMRHKPLRVMTPTSGLYFEDYRPKRTSVCSKTFMKENRELSNQLDQTAERVASVIGILLSVVMTACIIVVFVVLALLAG